MKNHYLIIGCALALFFGIDSLLSMVPTGIISTPILKIIPILCTIIPIYYILVGRSKAKIDSLKKSNQSLEKEVEKRYIQQCEIEDERAFSKQVLDAANDLIMWFDRDLILQGVNEGAKIASGIKDEKDIIGKPLSYFYPNQEEDVKHASALYHQVMRTREPIRKYPFNFKSRVTKKDAWLELNISPIVKNNEVVGVLICSSYITERIKEEQMKKENQDQLEAQVAKRTEELAHKNQEVQALLDKLQTRNLELEEIVAKRTEKLKEFNEELARSNKDLQQFAYMASHDLQEPLRIVSNFLSLLKRRYKDSIDDTGHEYINFAVDGAKRMSQLISSLLDYSRVGRKETGYQNANLNNTLELKLLDLGQVIKEKNVKVNLEQLPQDVYCERNQIGMVFYNLINNGIKFNTNESPTIEVKAHNDAPEGFWKFSVSDNGIGISDEYKEQVFEVFRRLHSKKDYPGTGIGLALCQKIVLRHGGKIWLESEPGEGTTFFFTIDKFLEEKHKAEEEEAKKDAETINS